MPSESRQPGVPQALRARWVFPVSSAPIRDGIVTFNWGQITSVGTDSEASKIIDLGNVALLPGLVNCHTHLEFSQLDQPLGRPGMRLPDWIAQVVAWRRSQGSNASHGITAGLTECASTGSVVVGEISNCSWVAYETGTSLLNDMGAEAKARSQVRPSRIIRFWELLGLAPEKVESLCAAARDHLEHSRPSSLVGLSPHAPYTVHPDVLKCAANLSAVLFVPLAMHLAESREELELLQHRSGPFVGLLENLNAWYPESLIYRRPLDYLQQLSLAARALVVHGNYLDDEEIQFLAKTRDHMSVVYCPRTHAYFQHERYPLARMLQQGVRVAIGTDSRASNPDLSVFNEMKHLVATHPEIEPERILRMATADGAAALGMDDDFGAMRPGAAARFAMARLTLNAVDPYEALWHAESVTAL